MPRKRPSRQGYLADFVDSDPERIQPLLRLRKGTYTYPPVLEKLQTIAELARRAGLRFDGEKVYS